MKLGFICLNLPGHLNPMTALACRLQDRNHDVVFPYSPGAAGLPFVSGPEKDQIEPEGRREQERGGMRRRQTDRRDIRKGTFFGG